MSLGLAPRFALPNRNCNGACQGSGFARLALPLTSGTYDEKISLWLVGGIDPRQALSAQLTAPRPAELTTEPATGWVGTGGVGVAQPPEGI